MVESIQNRPKVLISFMDVVGYQELSQFNFNYVEFYFEIFCF